MWGIPLIHVAISGDSTGRRVALGVIAIGDMAVGLVAIGRYAFGGVTIGGLSVGLISLAGLSAGLLVALGGLAFGGFAVGGLAIGLVAVGAEARSLWVVSSASWSLVAGLSTAVVTAAVVAGLVVWLWDSPRRTVPPGAPDPQRDHTE